MKWEATGIKRGRERGEQLKCVDEGKEKGKGREGMIRDLEGRKMGLVDEAENKNNKKRKYRMERGERKRGR